MLESKLALAVLAKLCIVGGRLFGRPPAMAFYSVWILAQGRGRMKWPMMAAFVVMAVIALMLLSGPWSPRMVEKDPAGMVVDDSPRPLAPRTPITPVPATPR